MGLPFHPQLIIGIGQGVGALSFIAILQEVTLRANSQPGTTTQKFSKVWILPVNFYSTLLFFQKLSSKTFAMETTLHCCFTAMLLVSHIYANLLTTYDFGSHVIKLIYSLFDGATANSKVCSTYKAIRAVKHQYLIQSIN